MQSAADRGGKTSADLCEVFPLLIEEAVGRTSWEELPESLIGSTSPWILYHGFPHTLMMFLWSLFLRCALQKREVEARGLGKM